MDDITVKVDGETKELVIRQGDALPLKERHKVQLSGTLPTPLTYLIRRVNQIDQLKAHLEFSLEGMNMKLTIEEENQDGAVVSGSLSLDPKFKLFGINKGNYQTPFQLAELIKMNRGCFENHSVAMDLVTQLKKFKAKIDKEVEKADDNRGNKKLLIDQIVTSNIPEAFQLNIPIFKGEKKQVFEVEVYFNSEDLTCTLISPQANDLIEAQKAAIFGDVLKEIETIAPSLVIVEI